MEQPASPGGPSLTPTSPLSRGMLAGAGALVLLHVALAWSVRQTAVATGNDDALYLLLGRAVRALTYRDLHILGQPWHSQYPPGYPLLLAVFGGELGPGINGAVVLGITLSAIGLLCFFDIARRFVAAEFALVLLAALAVNPQLLSYAGAVRSETPYMALTGIALWFLVRKGDSAGAVVAGVSFALLAALTRWVGVAFVAAVAVVWLLERRWRRLGWLAVAAGCTLGVWIAWTFLAPQQFEARSYGVMLTQTAPHESSAVRLLFHRALRTVNTYVLNGSLGTALGLPRVAGTRLDNLLGLGFACGLVLVGMVRSWRGGRVLSTYVVLFGGLLTVWTYKMTRFLVPITPVLLLLAATGAGALAARWGATGRRILLATFTAVFLAGGMQGYADMRRDHARCQPAADGPAGACLTEAQGDFFSAVAFLRDSTAPSALLISTKEAVLAFYTGRPVLHSQGARARFGERFVDGLRARGDAYILLASLHRWQVPTDMVERCGEFELMRSFPHDNDIVRLRPAGVPAADDGACRVIQGHAKAFIPPLPKG